MTAFYETKYGSFDTGVQAAVHRGAFSADIGQTSWLTADEWRHCLDWLDLSEGSMLLDVASGRGGPAVRAADQDVTDRVQFLTADAARPLPVDDTSVDAVTCIDATGNMATVAHRWHAARAEHRDELVRIEGAEGFDAQQRFLRVTMDLAGDRRLSRYVFDATDGWSA